MFFLTHLQKKNKKKQSSLAVIALGNTNGLNKRLPFMFFKKGFVLFYSIAFDGQS